MGAPPKSVLRFLRWFCRADYVEEIEGNLIEIFEKSSVRSQRAANFQFAVNVLKHFRPAFIKSFKPGSDLNDVTMLAHNILITFRSFKRFRSSFVINLFGLSAGLTSALLIYLWVYDELSIDRFHEKGKRLYQVRRHTPGPDKVMETHSSNSVLLPAALETSMPEVEYIVPLRPTPPANLVAGAHSVKATGAFAGKDFFHAFSFPVIHGSPVNALAGKYDLAISEQLAFSLFGSATAAIGKTVRWDLNHFGGDHTISAVFVKPKLSSEAFDFLITYELFLEKNQMDVNWGSNPILVNLTLKPTADVNAFSKKLSALYSAARSSDSEWRDEQIFLQPYGDLYLHNRFENGQESGGRIEYVFLFSAIGIVILVIACINFMNLSTARALRRLKEVGIKKTMGAQRRTLIAQHLGEAVVLAFLSFMISIIIVVLLLPQFNLLTGKQLWLQEAWSSFAGAAVIVLFTGVISGSYPAFYLSAFRPVDILKGKLASSTKEKFVRQGLVVFQFSISLLLLVGVFVIYDQLKFVQNKSIGYNRNNIILIRKQGELNKHLENFLTEVRETPGVIQASSIGASLTDNTNSSWGHNWEGQLPGNDKLEFSGATINFGFTETMGLQLAAGRSFSTALNDNDTKIMLNETAVKKMDMTDAVGKWMELFGTKREIIGVVKDFHFQSMYSDIRPLFLMVNPSYTNTIIIRLAEGQREQTINRVENIFKKIAPGTPFDFTFLDDEYTKLYQSEQRVSKLTTYFSVIAILLSCLGLFGLAAFSTERRVKEISVRKVLGCSDWKIVRLLTGEFAQVVIIACILTLPLSYYYSQQWLETFAYRIDLKWWIFGGAGTLTLATALVTVGVQTIKAARKNPVEYLKSE
jgi:ABC-type antimicrobial peptide transport system permease subunit